MRVRIFAALAFCLISSPLRLASQSQEEVDVKLKEISAVEVRLTWTSPPRKCGEKITYSVYRGTSPDFEASGENKIADGLINPSYVAHEPKSRSGWYYRVIAVTTPGYCPPPELKTGSIATAPLDLARDYRITLGQKSELCHASSTSEIECPQLLGFHAVIAAQGGHEFLIGCLSSDYGYGDCVNLSTGFYRITVHSQSVTVWGSGFHKINMRNGKDLGPITPIFSILGVLH